MKDEDYCEWSDLPREACEHCQTGEKRAGVHRGWGKTVVEMREDRFRKDREGDR